MNGIERVEGGLHGRRRAACRGCAWPGSRQGVAGQQAERQASGTVLSILVCLARTLHAGRKTEERRRLLHIVIVGGGPTGVEFAGELSNFVQSVRHPCKGPGGQSDGARIRCHVAGMGVQRPSALLHAARRAECSPGDAVVSATDSARTAVDVSAGGLGRCWAPGHVHAGTKRKHGDCV